MWDKDKNKLEDENPFRFPPADREQKEALIKKPFPETGKGFSKKSATTYSPTNAVPSALTGLTSLFGMGRGGTPSLKSP